ncbi:MAG: molybdopterin-containing oxidoreductase family protein [Myxococcota bacterium]
MPQTHSSFCRICEALCGLEIETDGGRITKIRPDPQNVATGGFGCVKGLKQMSLYQSPDRLTRPLKRVGDRFEPIPWPQALSEIGAKVAQLRGDHSPHALAMYIGTAAGFGVMHPIFAKGFMDAIGSRNMYGSSTQDCANKFSVSKQLYGFPFTLTFPDVERTQCLVMVGANPMVSKWSFLQVPDPSRVLRRIEERGGRVFIVDPRRTETAKVAGEHVFIRPGTDVFFYLSFLNELLRIGAVDRALIDAHTTGFDGVVDLAAPWTPECTEDVTRIPAETLREMVRAYAEADGAVLYCSTGVNMGGQGALAFWIQEVINAVSGNLDRRGGSLVGHGIVDFPKLSTRGGQLTKQVRSRIGDFPAVNDVLPGAILPDEILTPGPEQIRGLFVSGGNPLLTMSGAGRLREALSELELLVVTDIFLNETASLAHYVLPATTPFERPDLPFVFPLLLGLQAVPYLQATEAVVPPAGEALDEGTVYLELCRAAGLPLFGRRAVQRVMTGLQRFAGPMHPSGLRALPQRLLLSTILRLSGNGSFAKLLREPHGRLRPDHKGGDFLGQRVVTEDGKLQLAPPELLEQAAGLEAAFAAEQSSAGELRLISKRFVKTHNSWTHNAPEYVRGEGDTNHLYMNPDDAKACGLANGDLADVTSETATVRIGVKLLADLMPGSVAMPHGWGHQHARGLSVAGRTAGVNVNLLAATGPEGVERISGMARMTGIPVAVVPASGPLDPTNWSGRPQPLG